MDEFPPPLHLTAVMVVEVVGFVANLLLNDKYDVVLRALRWTPQTQKQRTKVSLRFLYLILPKKTNKQIFQISMIFPQNILTLIIPVVS